MANRNGNSVAERSATRAALLVMGMHRSGTSALTGVIGLMGADLPNDLMAASDLNAKGFFESNRITGFDEDLLASAGFTVERVPGFAGKRHMSRGRL